MQFSSLIFTWVAYIFNAMFQKIPLKVVRAAMITLGYLALGKYYSYWKI